MVGHWQQWINSETSRRALVLVGNKKYFPGPSVDKTIGPQVLRLLRAAYKLGCCGGKKGNINEAARKWKTWNVDDNSEQKLKPHQERPTGL